LSNDDKERGEEEGKRDDTIREMADYGENIIKRRRRGGRASERERAKIVCNIRIHDMDVVGHKHKKEVGTMEQASERKRKKKFTMERT
jgi:hypothetical protein